MLLESGSVTYGSVETVFLDGRDVTEIRRSGRITMNHRRNNSISKIPECNIYPPVWNLQTHGGNIKNM